MDYNNTFAISKTGMALEQLRLEVATQNLSQMNQPARAGTSPYRPLRVVAVERPINFAGQVDAASLPIGGVGGSTVVPEDVQPRKMKDPGNPNADQDGFVTYPGIDHTAEMLNLMTAVRAYEANVVAFNVTKTMALKALDIGGNS